MRIEFSGEARKTPSRGRTPPLSRRRLQRQHHLLPKNTLNSPNALFIVISQSSVVEVSRFVVFL